MRSFNAGKFGCVFNAGGKSGYQPIRIAFAAAGELRTSATVAS
jgi:hypothetical protein